MNKDTETAHINEKKNMSASEFADTLQSMCKDGIYHGLGRMFNYNSRSSSVDEDVNKLCEAIRNLDIHYDDPVYPPDADGNPCKVGEKVYVADTDILKIIGIGDNRIFYQDADGYVCQIYSTMVRHDRPQELNELQPCPFCGGEAELLTLPTRPSQERKPLYAVACFNQNCEMSPNTPPTEDKEDAIDLWNRRG